MMKYFKTNKHLRADVAALKQQLKLKTDEAQGYKDSTFSLLNSSTPEIVVSKLLKRGVKWYDVDMLPRDEREAYAKEAQSIIRSKVFVNEVSAIVLDLVEEIAKNASSFEQVLTLRAKIVALELLKERLSNISVDKEEPQAPKEPFSTI